MAFGEHGVLRMKLKDLSFCLTERLKTYKEWQRYWKEANNIIDDLKAVDHDLWPHDYDGRRKHLWGWDYMRLDSAGFLQIEFDFNGIVSLYWRGENEVLGI